MYKWKKSTNGGWIPIIKELFIYMLDADSKRNLVSLKIALSLHVILVIEWQNDV
jgi:hypothetical protein